MFKVGDKVVCPMRGCGIIETVEERTFLDAPQEYFIVKILRSNMTIMIPTSKISNTNYRLISDSSTVEDALSILSKGPLTSPQKIPAKERIKTNTAKVNAGSLRDYAEVITDLTVLQKEKPLNSSEQALLITSRKFIAEEIGLIHNLSESEVFSILDEHLNKIS
ncbi:MAG: CarD family transcriptional regulator [Cellulosilyticaceae bacterium]